MMRDDYDDDHWDCYADDNLPDQDNEQVIDCAHAYHETEDASQVKTKPEAVLVGREVSSSQDKVRDQMRDHGATEFFPSFATNERRVPNLFVRSSLFSATQAKEKRTCETERLVVWGDKSDQSNSRFLMSYTGEQLDQYDLAVFESVLYLAGGRRVGRAFRLNASKIMKVMGVRSDSGPNIQRVKNSLKRLAECNLMIRDCEIKIDMNMYHFFPQDYESEEEYRIEQQTIFNDSLIHQDDPKKPYSIWLSAEIKTLCKQYVSLDCSVLKALSRRPIASWLYRYFKSHKPSDKYQYGVDTLSWLSGVSPQPLDDDTPEFTKFKNTLLDNLTTLSIETGKVGKPFRYVQSAWDNDNVAIS